jgi:predicted nucleic acid-binding protein
MVVVDSSALVPLAWVGRLNLVTDVLEDIRTVDGVRAEVLVEGKRGVATLETLLDGVSMHPRPSNAERVAELEGLSVTDAAVILLADAENDVLLANDKALIDVAESHGIEGWWVTTLLLKCAKEGVLSGEEAADVLYELVDEGTNLNPKVYARLQRELHENGE